MARMHATPLSQGSRLEKFSWSCPDSLIHLYFLGGKKKLERIYGKRREEEGKNSGN